MSLFRVKKSDLGFIVNMSSPEMSLDSINPDSVTNRSKD